jgi:hypothetical protein
MKRQRIKVHCVANRSGYYTSLKIGEWYDAVDGANTDINLVHHYLIYWGKVQHRFAPYLSYGESDYAIYEKELFRTTAEKRELALEKLGI